MTNTTNPLDYVEMAKTLTGSSDIDIILDAATKLNQYTGNISITEPIVEWVPQKFESFLKYISHAVLYQGVVPFKPYDFQKEFARTLNDRSFVVHCTSRQMGTTLMLASFALWFALSSRKQKIIFATNRSIMSKEIIDRIRVISERLPMTFNGFEDGGKPFELSYQNGSKISFRPYSTFQGESFDDVDLIILHDVAFCSDAYGEHIKAGLGIASNNGTKIIASSCPARPSETQPQGLFWDLWTTAAYDERVHHPWTVHSGRTEEWISQIRAHLGPEAFAREFEARFTSYPK